MGYVEIKLYGEIENRFNKTAKYKYMENWKRFHDDCKILLNADKAKPIVIYLCIHDKCNPWDYVTMTRDVRLFKVLRACFRVKSPSVSH